MEIGFNQRTSFWKLVSGDADKKSPVDKIFWV